jgi:putative transcriptional regulator
VASPRTVLNPAHHPEADQLANYAGGAMSEAPALVIATHLALCPACRRQVADFEALGGELLQELPEEHLDADSLARTLARLERAPGEPVLPKAAEIASAAGSPLLPQPLRDYMSQAWAERGAWRSVMPGLRTLKLKASGAKVWMMELGPGRPIPHHGHRGQEMVLVLSGGYHDGETAYGPGDVQMSGPDIIHQPVADEDGPCLCLVMVEDGIRPTSLLGRVVTMLFGY